MLPFADSLPGRQLSLQSLLTVAQNVLISLSLMEINTERRSTQRIAVRIPVAIHSQDGSLQTSGHTRDLNAGGIFLYTQSKITAGSNLEMVLILPPELTQWDKRWVCCQASVVRVETSQNEGNFGVAAQITGMQLLPEITG